ncbi:hypothetical protein [Clostridium paridis]|uniref:DUF2383 domain-containing protein n=1 Tax=Clostridium paridis TaxID=2803863 RepID=A0A937K3Z2_9CLOT|nr:hypothetical protein [Clostridium paridis]MBL4931003.1 hypothetical protein [Clostridium paridis]
MAYNVIDLIDKAIVIDKRRIKMYENIANENADVPSIRVISKVLIKQVKKTIEYYEAIKEEAKKLELDEIDFYVYDKIAFIINEFSKKLDMPEIHNVNEFLVSSLNLNRDLKALFIDVQGRFVKNEKDVKSETYRILSLAIKNKEKQIKALEELIKH